MTPYPLEGETGQANGNCGGVVFDVGGQPGDVGRLHRGGRLAIMALVHAVGEVQQQFARFGLEDERFVSGDYDTSILDDSTPPAEDPEDLVPVVAAALAMHRRVRKTPVPPPGTSGTSAWVQAGRDWWRRR